MAILDNRSKIKSNLIELGRFTFFSVKKTAAFIMIITCCYLLYFSPPRLLTSGLIEVVGRTMSVGSLIYKESIQVVKSVSNKISYFKDLEAENLRLKFELASFKGLNQLAMHLELENKELKKILHVPAELERSFVTAKVVGMAINPFASTAIIQAGSSDNIKVNDIARGKDGLIGRVIDVSNNYATIMLASDHNSRIPVITGTSKVRGILARQGDNLKMIYLKENHDAVVGETIYTSGDGKIYPKDIEVARIERIANEGAFVKIIEDFDNLEFVVVETQEK